MVLLFLGLKNDGKDTYKFPCSSIIHVLLYVKVCRSGITKHLVPVAIRYVSYAARQAAATICSVRGLEYDEIIEVKCCSGSAVMLWLRCAL